MRQRYVQFRLNQNPDGSPTIDLTTRLQEARDRLPNDTLQISLGNEPDEAAQGNMTPQEFADAYYVYHSAIQAIDANTEISAAGITSSPTGLQWYEDFRTAWAANPTYTAYSQSINGTDYPPVHAFDAHLYGSSADPNESSRPRNRNAYKHLQDIYAFMDARPELQGKELIISETGLLDWWTWGHDTPLVSGYDPSPTQYMTDLINLINADDRIIQAIWFSTDDPGGLSWFEAPLFDASNDLTTYGQIFRDTAGGCFGEFEICSLDTTHADCDEDQDGLAYAQELSARTDPNETDTDGDGVDDFMEVLGAQTSSPINACEPNPGVTGVFAGQSDQDNDGIRDECDDDTALPVSSTGENLNADDTNAAESLADTGTNSLVFYLVGGIVCLIAGLSLKAARVLYRIPRHTRHLP